MYFIPYFAAPFDITSSVNTLCTPSDKVSRKRKRGSEVSKAKLDGLDAEVSSTVHDLGLSPTSMDSRFEPSQATGRQPLSQSLAVQGELFEQPLGRDLSEEEFSPTLLYHGKKSPHPKVHSKLGDKLIDVRRPLGVIARPSRTRLNRITAVAGFRQRHLAALTAVTQRSLLKGDYVRAGRAWGMLLRAELSGHSIDLRIKGQWALGAEILLQCQTLNVQNEGRCGRNIGCHETENKQQLWESTYGILGFEQAKDYYERLILQYPYRKAFPDTTGPQDFYVAMFGLWIYSIGEQHSVLLANVDASPTDMGDLTVGEAAQGNPISASDLQRKNDRQTEAISQDSLRRAHEIDAGLKDLLGSPPYSDNGKLQMLQGLVDAWVEKLSHTTQLHRLDLDSSDKIQF